MWNNTNDKLPEEGKYVIAKHNRGTWHDNEDQENVNTVVVKLVRGISQKERVELRKKEEKNGIDSVVISGCMKSWSGRSSTVKRCGEHANNETPYCWDTFGTDSFFGQSITHWMEIPELI